MSGVIAVAKQNSVHLLSDAAAYTEGVVHAFAEKTHRIGKLKAAFTVTGPLVYSRFLRERMPWADSFDGVLEQVPEVMPAVAARFVEIYPEHAARLGAFSVHLAGIRESTGRPEIWQYRDFSDAALAAHGVSREEAIRREGPPAVLNQVRPGTVFTAPAADRDYLALVGWRAASAEAFDPETDGVVVMEAMRRNRREPTGGAPNGLPADFVLGGWVDLVSIDASGYRHRRVHEWTEDAVGQTVRPGVVPLAAGQNRQQRRAAERQARRA